jgi:hypothetical protein
MGHLGVAQVGSRYSRHCAAPRLEQVGRYCVHDSYKKYGLFSALRAVTLVTSHDNSPCYGLRPHLRVTDVQIHVAGDVGFISGNVIGDGTRPNWQANSPLASWFGAIHNKMGAYCCSNADGKPVEDGDWDIKKDHYWVRLNLGWQMVPDGAARDRVQ